MAELVDAADLKSASHFGSAGSIPAVGTFYYQRVTRVRILVTRFFTAEKTLGRLNRLTAVAIFLLLSMGEKESPIRFRGFLGD